MPTKNAHGAKNRKRKMTDYDVRRVFKRRLEYVPVAEIAKEAHVTRAYIYDLYGHFPVRDAPKDTQTQAVTPEVGSEICWKYFNQESPDLGSFCQSAAEKWNVTPAQVAEVLYAMTDTCYTNNIATKFPAVEEWRRSQRISSTTMAERFGFAMATVKRYLRDGDRSKPLPKKMEHAILRETGLTREQLYGTEYPEE